MVAEFKLQNLANATAQGFVPRAPVPLKSPPGSGGSVSCPDGMWGCLSCDCAASCEISFAQTSGESAIASEVSGRVGEAHMAGTCGWPPADSQQRTGAPVMHL